MMDAQPRDKENKKLSSKVVRISSEGQVKSTNVNRRAAGSNWQLANKSTNNNNNNNNNKTNNSHNSHSGANVNDNERNERDVATTEVNQSVANSESNETVAKVQQKSRRQRNKWGNKHIAMDCEMVGIGPNGNDDMLARVSIVNRHGSVLMDRYVKPTAEVVDYRTNVSGIRPADIECGDDFALVQQKVIDMLQGRYLVGHGLRKDLAVLKITHPMSYIRDTSTYKPLARLVANGRTPSLKRLVHCILGQQIQSGEHDSVEDARAAMNIYNSCCADWEKYIQRKMR